MSTKFRVVLGLAGITISLIMLAAYLGFIPDKDGAVRSGRTNLAESIAVHSTALVAGGQLKQLTGDLELISKRNEELLSIGLRRLDGRTISATPGHQENWIEGDEKYSRDSQVIVPIYDGERQWGRLELRFEPIHQPGILGFLSRPSVRLLVLMGGGCFLIFYFYLGRVLSLLDPSRAVPARVRAALDTLAEGLLILDKKQQIVLANQAFAKILEKTADELVGLKAGDMPWLDADGNKVEKGQHPWVNALEQKMVLRNQTLQIIRPGSKKMIFNVSCSPVMEDEKNYAGVLVSFDDITPLEETKVELRISKEEAESANRAKSQFLANMSHEIRTPMNSILGFTEILKRGYVKNEHESLRYLNIINSSGKNLLDLINDILDLSKVESGKFDLEYSRVAPDKMIGEVLQMIEIKSKEKGLELRFEAEGMQPETIETDLPRLRQIFFNLLGNAIKFTDKGSVVVTSRLHNDSDTPHYTIEVKDSGIGIDQENLDLIFDPFVQAEPTTSRRFGGTGLGLAISRKFARALGGDVTVTSEIGVGSCFKVTVPTGSLESISLLDPETVLINQHRQESAEEVRWEFPPARVLVVDDGAENRELVSFLLTEAGLSVDQAENGQVGVDKALATDYQAILMDVQMPVMDGMTATVSLREHGLTTPIVALTANAMRGFEEQCLEVGYSSYLSKPIEVDRFMNHLAELLGGTQVEAEPGDDPDSLMSKEHAAETRNSQGKEQTMVPASSARPIVSKLPMDNKKFQELVSRFVKRLSEQVKAMEATAAEGKMAELAALAHWLKGAGGTVGFDDFTAPAALLEKAAKEGREGEALTALITIQELISRIQVPSGEQNVSPFEKNAERNKMESVELTGASAEPIGLNPNEEAQNPAVLKGDGQEPLTALSEAETAHENTDHSDTALLWEEERQLKEEFKQSGAISGDDFEFFTLTEEEIMELDTSCSQSIEEPYSTEVEIDNT
ncbi:MAG: response regulator [Desulfofustis sp.]|nr:response regulator [Desulfofustis sp.]